MWYVGSVGCWEQTWDVGDVRDVGYLECGMLAMWDVGDVGCWGCEMWDIQGCGMFGMWDVWEVGCGMFAGMWDVDLQNVPMGFTMYLCL